MDEGTLKARLVRPFKYVLTRIPCDMRPPPSDSATPVSSTSEPLLLCSLNATRQMSQQDLE